MLGKVFALATLGLAGASRFFDSDPEQLRALWEDWKQEHKRSYGRTEDEHRFQIFVSNLKVIDQRNAAEVAAGGEEVHGLTRFADITQEEFEATYLGADPFQAIGGAENAAVSQPVSAAVYQKDWTGIYTTPIKDQGQCGSCWAFSAMSQIESDAIRTAGWCNGNPNDSSCWLSAQQITSCDSTSSGCNGGWTENAYKYVMGTTNGLETENQYPYTSGTTEVTGTCQANSQGKVSVKNYYTITNGEDAMGNYVNTTGPLSVCLCAATWNFYTGGIMSSCCRLVDHCVQAVGVDTVNGYWKVRNQWGTSWGESGYIRLAYGANTCRITNDPTYAAVYLS